MDKKFFKIATGKFDNSYCCYDIGRQLFYWFAVLHFSP